jgi:hypothetical protein
LGVQAVCCGGLSAVWSFCSVRIVPSRDAVLLLPVRPLVPAFAPTVSTLHSLRVAAHASTRACVAATRGIIRLTAPPATSRIRERTGCGQALPFVLFGSSSARSGVANPCCCAVGMLVVYLPPAHSVHQDAGCHYWRLRAGRCLSQIIRSELTLSLSQCKPNRYGAGCYECPGIRLLYPLLRLPGSRREDSTISHDCGGFAATGGVNNACHKQGSCSQVGWLCSLPPILIVLCLYSGHHRERALLVLRTHRFCLPWRGFCPAFYVFCDLQAGFAGSECQFSNAVTCNG